jgi:Tol biopolymer transport system component
VIKNGGQLIVIQIPTKEQLYYRYFAEVIKSYQINPQDLDMEFPNTFLSGICQTNGIAHLDLTQEFGSLDKEIFYQYDEHLNEFGHDQLSTIISNHFDSLKTSNGIIKLLSEYNTEDRYPIQYDSNLLTFQSVRDSNIELFISKGDTHNAQRITFNDIDEFHPCLNTRANKILFTEGDQDRGETKIAIMDLDGTNRDYITKGSTFGAIPFWNKEGTKIAYAKWTSDSSGNKTQPYIVVDDLEKLTQVVITSPEYESWRPVFSPDDRFLFYISKRDDKTFDIYRYEFSTQKEENLTKTNYDEWDVAVSRDGKEIAYAANKNKNWDLFIMDLATAKTIQLTNSLGDEWDPSFGIASSDLLYAGTFGFMNGIFKMKVAE